MINNRQNHTRIKTQEFTTTGTWINPGFVKCVSLVLVGGGGPGIPGVNTSCGGGGKAGKVVSIPDYPVTGDLSVIIGGQSGFTTVGNVKALGGAAGSYGTPEYGVGQAGEDGYIGLGSIGGAGGTRLVNNGIGGAGAVGGAGGGGGMNPISGSGPGAAGGAGGGGYVLISWVE